MTPPYLQIAESLRDRIMSGALQPGQPVPSTRKIVSEWGVAMATASKALTELRNQGLVHVLPGVGTVVTEQSGADTNDPPGSPPHARHGAIVRCAVRIADTEGIAALSMRRIAADLGIAPMSLYRHVANKEELLLLMRENTFGDVVLPDPADRTWRDQLELSATALWKVYRQHPWLARTSSLTRPHAGPNQLRYSEWCLRVLTELGFDPETAFLLHVTLFNLVHGTAASLESETHEQAETGLDADRWIRRRHERGVALITSGRYPYAERVFLSGSVDLDLDDVFATALTTMLDGIATRIGDAPCAFVAPPAAQRAHGV